ncbi:MAG: SBBP repeat-containing protein, partial [Candidatus Sifarchaeia archaeon]
MNYLRNQRFLPIVSIAALTFLILFMAPLLAASNSSGFHQAFDDGYNCAIAGGFLENRGQISDPSLHFYTRIPGGYIGIQSDGVAYWTDSMGKTDLLVFEYQDARIPIGQDPLSQMTNYYLGEKGTYTNIRSYERVLFSEIASGINLLLLDTEEGIICEFGIADGSCSEDFEALTSGLLEIGDYRLSSENNVRRFLLVDQTQSQARVKQAQNPFLSMYLGGSGRDEAEAIARDSSGNLFVTGFTSSLDFPLVNELYPYQGARDVFVTMFDEFGSIVYSTYIGGSTTSLLSTSPDDEATDILVDQLGNVYITGNTKSDDFPTLNPMYSVALNNSLLREGYYDAEGDVFLLKLDSSGQLNYSTYLGGTDGESGTSLALDSDGNIYIGGITSSSDFPLVDAFDTQTGMTHEGFISCISASGDEILFSSFVGGSASDAVYDIAIDESGNIVLTGYTEGGLALRNPLFSTQAGQQDAFAIKINSSWNIVYATYLGGNGSDFGNSVAIDAWGAAYITGRTGSSNFPIHQALYNDSQGSDDCFITVISDLGDELLFSSYIGGSGTDSGETIVIDANNDVYIAGTTWSANFPTSTGMNSGGADAFVLKTDLNRILHSRCFGGQDEDKMYSMAIDPSNNNTFICGSTLSEDFPSAGQKPSSSGYDAFIVGYELHYIPLVIDPPGPPLAYITSMTILLAALGVASVLGISQVIIRRAKLEEYEVAMKEVPEPLWNHPPDTPDGTPTPEPLWNHPPDTPDGTPTPEPLWNHPPDTPDGTPTPEPLWNHP